MIGNIGAYLRDMAKATVRVVRRLGNPGFGH